VRKRLARASIRRPASLTWTGRGKRPLTKNNWLRSLDQRFLPLVSQVRTRIPRIFAYGRHISLAEDLGDTASGRPRTSFTHLCDLDWIALSQSAASWVTAAQWVILSVRRRASSSSAYTDPGFTGRRCAARISARGAQVPLH